MFKWGDKVYPVYGTEPDCYQNVEGTVVAVATGGPYTYKVEFKDAATCFSTWYNEGDLVMAGRPEGVRGPDAIILPHGPVDKLVSSFDFETAVRSAFDGAEELLLERHKKYGPKNISHTPYGWKVGLITRLSDKLARLQNMEGDATDESRVDAWMDICCYGLIGLLNERGQWPSA